jgi:hypothetical protein
MADIKKERQKMQREESNFEHRVPLKRQARYMRKCMIKVNNADSDNDEEKWSHRTKLSKKVKMNCKETQAKAYQ